MRKIKELFVDKTEKKMIELTMDMKLFKLLFSDIPTFVDTVPLYFKNGELEVFTRILDPAKVAMLEYKFSLGIFERYWRAKGVSEFKAVYDVELITDALKGIKANKISWTFTQDKNGEKRSYLIAEHNSGKRDIFKIKIWEDDAVEHLESNPLRLPSSFPAVAIVVSSNLFKDTIELAKKKVEFIRLVYDPTEEVLLFEGVGDKKSSIEWSREFDINNTEDITIIERKDAEEKIEALYPVNYLEEMIIPAKHKDFDKVLLEYAKNLPLHIVWKFYQTSEISYWLAPKRGD